MIGRILQFFRARRALKALAAYSAAKDAHRRAVVAGNTRLQHHTQLALEAAMTARLKAERVLITSRR